jgi:hypothetical protein
MIFFRLPRRAMSTACPSVVKLFQKQFLQLVGGFVFFGFDTRLRQRHPGVDACLPEKQAEAVIFCGWFEVLSSGRNPSSGKTELAEDLNYCGSIGILARRVRRTREGEWRFRHGTTPTRASM